MSIVCSICYRTFFEESNGVEISHQAMRDERGWSVVPPFTPSTTHRVTPLSESFRVASNSNPLGEKKMEAPAAEMAVFWRLQSNSTNPFKLQFAKTLNSNKFQEGKNT